MSFLLWKVGHCKVELQVLECGCHEMNSLLKTGYCGMILQVLVG